MNQPVYTISFLPDRLNREPVIFRGLTNSEMFLLVKLAALVWFPVCVLLCWWLGAAVIGLGAGMAMTMASVVAGGMVLQRKKRGKPEGWYERHLKIAAQQYGLAAGGFHRYSGAWDVRRTERRR